MDLAALLYHSPGRLPVLVDLFYQATWLQSSGAAKDFLSFLLHLLCFHDGFPLLVYRNMIKGWCTVALSHRWENSRMTQIIESWFLAAFVLVYHTFSTLVMELPASVTV